MKKYFTLFISCLVVFVINNESFAEKRTTIFEINDILSDTNELHRPIIRFFDGLSLVREDLIVDNTTKDFLLLEAGLLWNNDTLINRIRPLKNTNFERKNEFKFIATKQQGNIAWVSYWNQATISRNGNSRILKWLESVVLVKEDERWKIQLMHSTPIR